MACGVECRVATAGGAAAVLRGAEQAGTPFCAPTHGGKDSQLGASIGSRQVVPPVRARIFSLIWGGEEGGGGTFEREKACAFFVSVPSTDYVWCVAWIAECARYLLRWKQDQPSFDPEVDRTADDRTERLLAIVKWSRIGSRTWVCCVWR